MSDTYAVDFVGNDKLSTVLQKVAQNSTRLNTAATGAKQSIETLDKSMERTANNTATTAGWAKYGVLLGVAGKAIGAAKRMADSMGKNLATQELNILDIKLKSISASLADIQTDSNLKVQLRDTSFAREQTTRGVSGGARDVSPDIEDSNEALKAYKGHLDAINASLETTNDRWKTAYGSLEKQAQGLVDKIPDAVKNKLGDLTTALTGLGIPLADTLNQLGGKETLDSLDQEREKLRGMKEQLEGILRGEQSRNTLLKAQSEAVYEQNVRFKEQVDHANRLAQITRDATESARKAANEEARSGGLVRGWNMRKKPTQEEAREARRETYAQQLDTLPYEEQMKEIRRLNSSRATRKAKKSQETLGILGSLTNDEMDNPLRGNATATEYARYADNISIQEQKRGETALEQLAKFLLDQLTQK